MVLFGFWYGDCVVLLVRILVMWVIVWCWLLGFWHDGCVVLDYGMLLWSSIIVVYTFQVHLVARNSGDRISHVVFVVCDFQIVTDCSSMRLPDLYSIILFFDKAVGRD
jgi:hypothetical protein